MPRQVASSEEKGVRAAVTHFKRLTLEEEIMSLYEFAPRSLAQLHTLFAESVVDSAMKVLGETTGEALIRCIGDSRLKEPEMVYQRLDTFLLTGSEPMKRAIRLAFTSKVHRLYKLTFDVESHSSPYLDHMHSV